MLQHRWPSRILSGARRAGSPIQAAPRRVVGARSARLAPAFAATIVGTAFIAWHSVRVGDWAVMTDELLYSKLAIAIGESGSPIPSVHGEYFGALGQLYPLLLAPLFAIFDVPTAFRVAHGLNAAIMASAAIPIYLLARIALTRAWAGAVALAGVVTPWTVLAGFLMSDVVAFPAFLWATLAIVQTVVRPGRRADAFALLALTAAVLARTQFLALVLVLPLAVVGHELGYTAACRGGRRALLEAARTAVARHRVLVGASVLGAAGALLIAAFGSLAGLLGNYAVTVTEGSLLPSGVWSSAVEHLDAVALGIGVVPLLLGSAWALGTVVRPAGKDLHGLAVVIVLVVPALSLQAASYDLRFGETAIVRDRYLFYVAPLLLVAALAGLLERRQRTLLLLLLLATTAAFAWTVRWYDFHVVEPFTTDSPVSLLNERVVEHAGGLTPATFVALAALMLGGALVAARAVVSDTVLAGAFVAFVLLFGTVATHDAFARVLASTGPSGRQLTATPGSDESWIDPVLPDGSVAGIVPFPLADDWATSAVRWWDVEFWNRSVRRAYVGANGTFSYTPFPVDDLVVDPLRGRVLTAGEAPDYVVVATSDVRFRLAGPRRAARHGLELLELERPARAEWATRGLQVDGWLRPRRPARVRAFARPGAPSEIVALDVVLKAPPTEGISYRIGPEAAVREASAPADAAVVERVELCVPARGYADARIVAAAAGVMPGPPLGPEIQAPRAVGARVESITLQRTGSPCPD